MKLIIAEKPELGRYIVNAIDGTEKKGDGCIYRGDYAVTWAFGHLLTLMEPEDYDPAYANWSLEHLPFYFPEWEHKPKADEQGRKGESAAERLEKIGRLMKEAECVISAGDPDEEGQYIIDEIIHWHRYEGPVYRLNTNDTTVLGLQQALQNLSDNKEFEPRGVSAYARSVADIMVGINLSRFYTIMNRYRVGEGKTITIGRVQTPTLGLVVRRDKQIEAHVKEKYYIVEADALIGDVEFAVKYCPNRDNPHLDSNLLKDKTYASLIAGTLEGWSVRGYIKREMITEHPPLPFDLVELQSFASRKFGYDPSKTLAITQTLRDKHNAISYNRSDCRYLNENQFKEAAATMNTVAANIRYRHADLDMGRKSKAFNEEAAREAAHTAIIPQNQSLSLDKLTEEEKNIYLAIVQYYMTQFMPPARKEKTTFEAQTPEGGTLKATSVKILEQGYLSLFKNNPKDEDGETEETSYLSTLPSGDCDAVIIGSRITEKETAPPKRYTQASLNKDMTQIAKFVTDPEIKDLLLQKDKDKKGENGSIGTVATRAGIITNLIKRGFLEERGKNLISTPLGREMIEKLPEELTQPNLTAKWWSIQDDIQKGEADAEKLADNVFDMILSVFSEKFDGLHNSTANSDSNIVGACPLCGGTIYENQYSFRCGEYKEGCKFTVWKKSKLPSLAKTVITRSNMEDLLSGKAVEKTKLVSKAGNEYSGKIVLEIDKSNEQYPVQIRIQWRQ